MRNIPQISQQNTCLESLLDEVASLKACNIIKKGLQHRCFQWNLRKFLRTPILKSISERLLLIGLMRIKNCKHHLSLRPYLLSFFLYLLFQTDTASWNLKDPLGHLEHTLLRSGEINWIFIFQVRSKNNRKLLSIT